MFCHIQLDSSLDWSGEGQGRLFALQATLALMELLPQY